MDQTTQIGIARERRQVVGGHRVIIDKFSIKGSSFFKDPSDVFHHLIKSGRKAFDDFIKFLLKAAIIAVPHHEDVEKQPTVSLSKTKPFRAFIEILGILPGELARHLRRDISPPDNLL